MLKLPLFPMTYLFLDPRKLWLHLFLLILVFDFGPKHLSSPEIT